MQDLLLPSEVEFSQGESATSADLIITPCHFGYGTTLGNALRRVLLSSLPGAAVEAFKIKGTQHEFTAVDGVKEDVVQIILNLKQLAVKVYSDEMIILKLKRNKKGEIKAKDIENNSEAEIMNSDLVIATLTQDKDFEMDIIVGQGRGFTTVEEKDKKDYDLGTIVIDSIYNPVKDVGYSVEYTRVGDITNYEKLTLHVETNGVLTPREAINLANKTLMDHFNILNSTLSDGSSGLASVETAMVADVIETKTKTKKKTTVKKTKKDVK